MADKLVIKRVKPSERSTNPLIRINKEAGEVLADVANEAGISKYRLASEMILFAAEHIEVEEE